jgi:hypothetical protein
VRGRYPSIEQTPPHHPAGLLTLRTLNDLAMRSNDLLARSVRLEQALAQQK